MATNGDGPSFFARYVDDGRPVTEEIAKQQVPLAAGRLLGWLQNH